MENICDYKNCKKIGKHKAPIEKDNSKKFRWLCLDHIKEFNRSWDYFKGMSDQEVCKFLKSDMTWHKPTQSFSSPDNFFNILWKNALNEGESILSNGYGKKIKMKKKVVNLNNKAINEVDLPDLIFNIKVLPDLIQIITSDKSCIITYNYNYY